MDGAIPKTKMLDDVVLGQVQTPHLSCAVLNTICNKTRLQD